MLKASCGVILSFKTFTIFLYSSNSSFSFFSKAKEDLEYRPTDLKTSITDMAYSLIDAGFIKKTAKYQKMKD